MPSVTIRHDQSPASCDASGTSGLVPSSDDWRGKEPDGCDELVAARIAGPSMVNTAANVETGFLGDEEHTATTRAVRPSEIFRCTTAGRESETGRMGNHRFSSTLAPVPSSILSHLVGPLWRHRDTGVKLSWRDSQRQRVGIVASMAPRAGANASRSGRNWCGRTSSNPRACRWYKARGPRTSRPQTKGQRRRAPQAVRADYRRRDCQPSYGLVFGIFFV